MISKQKAIILIIGLLSLVILFHLAVVFGLIPYEIVWAGRLDSKNEMYLFEALSILLNTFLITVFWLKFQHIRKNETNRFINGTIWVFLFLFTLNSFGNLFAENWIERSFGTLLTFTFTILCWIVIRPNSD